MNFHKRDNFPSLLDASFLAWNYANELLLISSGFDLIKAIVFIRHVIKVRRSITDGFAIYLDCV